MIFFKSLEYIEFGFLFRICYMYVVLYKYIHTILKFMCLHTAKVEVTSYLRSRNVFKQFRANIWILKLRFCFKVYLRSLWWKKTIRMKNFKNQMLTRNTSLNSFLDHRLEATATLGTYMYYWILLELIIFTFVLYILF